MTPLEVVTTILFDFHATLACSRDANQWIQAAHEHAGQTVSLDVGQPGGNYQRAQKGLRQEWVLARKRDPSCSWDLSAVAHRKAFTTVMTTEAGCANWLADGLYDVMVDQWHLYDVMDVASVPSVIAVFKSDCWLLSLKGVDH